MLPVRCALLLLAGVMFASDWPQFRGPNAGGVGEDAVLPVEFGPATNVAWKTPLPPGHSSPVIAGGRIWLTAYEGDKLLTFALDQATGRILWRREAPRPRKQQIDRPANGPASASAVTDGRNVFVFFQDFGLLAYGPDGNEIWRVPLGPFNNPFGHGASPILAGNTLLMNCDQDTGSFLLALDKNTGRELWRTARPHAQRGYATPVVYNGTEVVVAGSYRLSGYDLATGKELWYIRGLPWQIKPTPIIAGDVIYFITFSGESEPGEQQQLPTFAEALAQYDADRNGRLSKAEVPDERNKARFDEYLDLDHSGYLEERDWNQLRDRRMGENGLRAYRLGGRGDITGSGRLWSYAKSLPNVPSPLYYRGVLYTLKEGGIFTSFDPNTGAVLKQGRIAGALDQYSASPIGSGGRIYTVSETGQAAVLQAGAEWELLRVNDLDEVCKATPAVADGKMYLRTFGALYCFASAASQP